MPTNTFHHLQTDNHRIENFVFADATARGLGTGYTIAAQDVGKIAYQSSDESYWRLTDDSPITWVSMAATSGSVSTVADDLAAHIADTANPHSVTKTQVGLPNVTNDAQVKVSEVDGSTLELTAGTLHIKDAGVTDAKLAVSYLKADGTRALTGDLSAGGHKITNVGTPTGGGDAINKTYADALIAAGDAEIFVGAIDCSANPNYPAADLGNVYRVSVAGKIGGASGTPVLAGDRLQCLQDGTASGDQATVGAYWWITGNNSDGDVIGPAGATDGYLAAFDGVTGKLIKALSAAATKTFLAIAQADVTGLVAALAAKLTNPLTTLGDIIYAGAAGAVTRLAGQTTATRKFLRQTGDGAGNSAAPVWDTLVAGDIPNIAESQVTNLTTDLAAKAASGANADITKLTGITGQVYNAKGADIASANNLVLGADGNLFHITGTTQINLIASTNWQAGCEIDLIFDGALVVKHNTAVSGANKPILLAGAVDFNTVANSTLSLRYDGTSWYEIGRNGTTPIVIANNQTASYTLILTDAGKVVEMNNASANNLTIPPVSSVAWQVGTVIEVWQQGAGQTTLVPGSGVTIRSDGAKLKCNGQYATVGLRMRANDEWIASGDLSA